MKPDWLNQRLSRWSKRAIKMLSFSIATLFVVVNVAFSVSSAVPSSDLETADILRVEQALPIAQNTSGNATLYFNTPTYVVSVHPRSGPLRMNVYNKNTRQAEQLEAPASYRGALGTDGFVSYESLGSRNNDNVVFRASANRDINQARLEIISSANQVITNESSTSISAISVPQAESSLGDDLFRSTILAFETPAHAVRIYQGNGNTRQMNVYNKLSQRQVVNGQPASLENPPVTPYENWVSYYGGSDYNGVPARYFARVNSSGQAILEVLSNQGSVLISEQRITTSPLIVNIPAGDIPPGVDAPSTTAALSPYIAAVFGDDNTLQQLRSLYDSNEAPRTFGGQNLSEPYFESAPQGQFINAGSFDNRDQAASVVSYLRSRGFNARLVFRDFRYR